MVCGVLSYAPLVLLGLALCGGGGGVVVLLFSF
jgi:hypothetical protein